MFGLSTNSADINIFTQSIHKNEMALKNSSYKAKLSNKPMDEAVDVRNGRNNRVREILWFTTLIRYGSSK